MSSGASRDRGINEATDSQQARWPAWVVASCLALSGCQPSSGPTPGPDAAPGDSQPETTDPARVTVVLFLIDGLQARAVQTALASGAKNMQFLLEHGVTVDTSYATSPASRLTLPDNSLPWGNATSGNVAVHTGCHLFESHQMDDIFLDARAAGIKSVFAGGDANYSTFTSADFHYADNLTDAVVVADAIEHVKNDDARLIRVHLQRIRDSWTGPGDEMDAASAYIRHLVLVDGLLGQLIQALQEKGAWANAYVVLTSDHGMGQTVASAHPPSTASSWHNFMAFYGPGIKQGATIPYAEAPDVAIMTNHFFGLAPPRGHTDPAVTLGRRGPTGTYLANIFEGAPQELAHPRYIERYLQDGSYVNSADDYAPYRLAMLQLLP